MAAGKIAKFNAATPPPKAPTVELVPGYWRGRAKTCRLFADQERQAGHMRAADELDRQAIAYDARADALAANNSESSAHQLTVIADRTG